MTLRSFPSEPSEFFRRRVIVAGLPELTADFDTIATFPGRLYRLGGRGEAASGPYFSGDPSFAIDRGGRLHVSDTLQYRIETYGSGGSLERVTTRAVDPSPFDPAWEAEIEEGIWAALRRDGLPSNAEAQVDRLMAGALPPDPPEHLSFIEDLLVASDGSMWVERADRHPRPAMAAVAHVFGWLRHDWPPEWVAPRILDVFTADGKYRGTVELDGLFEPMAVTPDRVYGVLYDELGVEFIVAYRVYGGRGSN